MPDAIAKWSISLNCDCPNCGRRVNLLDRPGFWDDTGIVAAEWGTDATQDMRVACPLCGDEFVVDCEL